MFFVPVSDRKFEDTQWEGIRSAPLWEVDGTGAYFAEFKTGTVFPRHDHSGPEQFLLLSGRFRFNDLVMEPGDFLQAGHGDVHIAEAIEDSFALVTFDGPQIFKD